MRLVRLALAVAMVIVLGLAGGTATATTYTWDNGDATTDWSAGANWNPEDGGEPPAAGDTAVIRATAAGNLEVMVDASTAVTDLDAQSLSWPNNRWITLDTPVHGTPNTLTVSNTIKLGNEGRPTVWGPNYVYCSLAGTASLEITVGGFAMYAASTYDGGTTVGNALGNALLLAEADGAVGSGAIVVEDKGTISFRTGQTTCPSLVANAGGAIRLDNQDGGAHDFAHPITLNGGTLEGRTVSGGARANMTATLTLTDDSTLKTGVTYDSRTLEVSGTIVGSSDLLVDSGRGDSFVSSVVISADNTSTFTGDVHVNTSQSTGRLELTATGALGGAGAVYVYDTNFLQVTADGALGLNTELYLLGSASGELDLDADLILLDVMVGGSLVGEDVIGGTPLPSGIYDGVGDPMDITDWVTFDGVHTLTILEPPPIAEPAGLSLVGLALLVIRRKRS